MTGSRIRPLIFDIEGPRLLDLKALVLDSGGGIYERNRNATK
jgi:hypothetical protein